MAETPTAMGEPGSRRLSLTTSLPSGCSTKRRAVSRSEERSLAGLRGPHRRAWGPVTGRPALHRVSHGPLTPSPAKPGGGRRPGRGPGHRSRLDHGPSRTAWLRRIGRQDGAWEIRASASEVGNSRIASRVPRTLAHATPAGTNCDRIRLVHLRMTTVESPNSGRPVPPALRSGSGGASFGSRAGPASGDPVRHDGRRDPNC
jgi:hypothetical protein